MAEDWTLDELAHAGAEHLDPAFVAGYDRKQCEPDPAEDVAVLTARGLGREATVVDLGAGTGQFALAAARAFGRVVAVDNDRAAGYTRADLAEHVRTEHSTYRWLLEPMLERAGLAIEDARYGAAVYAAYTCVRR